MKKGMDRSPPPPGVQRTHLFFLSLPQGAGLALLPPTPLTHPRVAAGLALWAAGFALNLWSDAVLRGLKKRGGRGRRRGGEVTADGYVLPPARGPFGERKGGVEGRGGGETGVTPTTTISITPPSPLFSQPSSPAPTTRASASSGPASPSPRGPPPRPRLRSSPPPTWPRAP